MILLSTCGKLASTSAVLHSWISWKAFGITSGQPYMVNMAFDPMMAGCLIYLIQAGVHSWPHGIGLGRHFLCRLGWPGKQANDHGIRQRQYDCTQRCLALPRHADGCVAVLCCVALPVISCDFLLELGTTWEIWIDMRGFPNFSGSSVFELLYTAQICT